MLDARHTSLSPGVGEVSVMGANECLGMMENQRAHFYTPWKFVLGTTSTPSISHLYNPHPIHNPTLSPIAVPITHNTHTNKRTLTPLSTTDDGSALQNALEEMTGQRSVPNIFIAKEHIGGNSDLQAKKSQLKNMLKEANAL